MKVRCRKCGVETPEEQSFCGKCRTRLVSRSAYDLTFDDFGYGPDRDAIETVRATGALPYLVKSLALEDFEKAMLARLSAEAHRVLAGSELDRLVRQCAVLLSVEVLPEVFIVDGGRPNAFTFGTEEHAFVVVDSKVLRLLTPRELTALFGHELGHVISGHMMYHTLAELVAGGFSLSASLMGLGALSIPIRLALLSWHRESEVTGDRASLLAVNDISVVNSLMIKLATSSGDAGASFDERAVKNDVGMLDSISELFHTHPLYTHRINLVKEFWESEEFGKARQKMERRRRLLKALVPQCRFCGARKQVVDLFCPVCGKSQT